MRGKSINEKVRRNGLKEEEIKRGIAEEAAEGRGKG